MATEKAHAGTQQRVVGDEEHEHSHEKLVHEQPPGRDGVISIRGMVVHLEKIREAEERVRRVPGVVGVENLLHLPGTPARRG